MADNFTSNPGSGGATFAADELAGPVLYPRVKVSVGGDGFAADSWTPYRLRSAATNNATSVKATAGTVGGYLVVTNTSATLAYLKFYNKASAPAPATDNALLVFTVPIPASTTGAGVAINLGNGFHCSSGIAIAVVGGNSDTDNTSVTAGDVLVNFGYV